MLLLLCFMVSAQPVEDVAKDDAEHTGVLLAADVRGPLVSLRLDNIEQPEAEPLRQTLNSRLAFFAAQYAKLSWLQIPVVIDSAVLERPIDRDSSTQLVCYGGQRLDDGLDIRFCAETTLAVLEVSSSLSPPPLLQVGYAYLIGLYDDRVPSAFAVQLIASEQVPEL